MYNKQSGAGDNFSSDNATIVANECDTLNHEECLTPQSQNGVFDTTFCGNVTIFELKSKTVSDGCNSYLYSELPFTNNKIFS